MEREYRDSRNREVIYPNECCDCEGCEYYDECMEDEIDEEDAINLEVQLLVEYVEKLLNRDFCPMCAFDFVKEIFDRGKSIGWTEHVDYIREVNEACTDCEI